MALRRGGATRTSGYLFLAPLFAALLSHWLLGASLSSRQAAGGLAIGLGIWLVNREVCERRTLSTGAERLEQSTLPLAEPREEERARG